MKRLTSASALALALIATTAQAEPAPQPQFAPEAVRAHVDFLADDLLEGRNTGTRGYDIAAKYVATRYEALGLKPAADGKWYQQVPFAELTLTKTPEATLTVGGKTFTHGKDVLIGVGAGEEKLTLGAPVVFVGFGIDSPGQGFDDYAGLDVKGKIVVALSGFPKGTPSDLGAHLANSKAKMASDRGAIGMITVNTRERLKMRPWARSVESAFEPSIAWTEADGTPHRAAPGLRATASVDTPAAQALFAGAPRSLDKILTEAERKNARIAGFALKPEVRVERTLTRRNFTSPNVVAMLPGSDPALANEYVLLMAHLDHVGIDESKEGDKIHNGAMDNAAGIATMLEVARAMANAPIKPRRPILFAAVTAEEKGLLGSEYLAHNPLTRAGKVVSVVNLDMPVLLYDFNDVIAFGAERSTLGPIVQKAAAGAGVTLSPDPMPAEGLFTRSDHYRFVQQGIPSVFLMTGFGNGGEKAFKDFLATHYHRVSDQTDLPIDWNAAAKFTRINYEIATAIADADTAPRWYAKDFFGDTFAPGADKVEKTGS
ncbi:M28 family metallopeptidase [Sphingomonas sp. C3-2]|uniref:M28 family metallopeptidase n=1 Tax=Sphingomonas sp. C3-2 TaxID=3062169 RepID=UPI00294B8005|nr:M28 family metallopeptidase [Sphingomonas sp. C3-2]WOK37865.1 M28 family metallopeptidase [Sphingomonas sp. C3-2]